MRRIIAAVTCLALAITGLAISPASTTEIRQVVASVMASSVATARPAVFPNGIQFDSSPNSGFNSISCSSPGNCTAVGSFRTLSFFNSVAFTQTQTNGTWADARPAIFGAGVQSSSPAAVLFSVSCPSDGNCTAVGRFKNAAGHTEAFTQTQTNGTWANAVPATFGAEIQNTSPSDTLKSVSCVSAGNCTAVGWFKSTIPGDMFLPSGAFETFTQTQTNGTWANAAPAVFVNGVQSGSPNDVLSSVSCTSAGNCTASGYFRNPSSQSETFTITQIDGVWAKAVPAVFGVGILDANNTIGDLTSVSCSSPGNCTAVGYFKNAADNIEAFTQTQTSGTWSSARPATFDAGVQNSSPKDSLDSISCTSSGNCVAVGKFKNAAGGTEAFIQTQTDGTWTNAIPATFGTGIQNTTRDAQFSSVSCFSVGNCVAAGGFRNSASGSAYEAFTQTQTNGTWANAIPATFGAGVQDSNPSAGFTSVSCPALGDCAAAGIFRKPTFDTAAFTLDNSVATPSPTPTPSASPSGSPSASPTTTPSASPSGSPSASPTTTPSASPSPSTSPSVTPVVKSLKLSVSFGERSSKLTATEKKKLLKAIATAGSKVISGTVVGYVQREGYSSNDKVLSAARAKAVAQFLSANGVKVRLVSMGKGALDSSKSSRKAVLNLRYTK